MGFGRKIQYFLVHSLNYTNKQAKALIKEKRVTVDGETIDSNVEIKTSDEITVDGKLVKEHKPIYLKYYKPVGYVSSLNENVENSLFKIFESYLPLTIVGRLDKASEGLLILTSDGKWAKQVTDPKNLKEKEYIVKVDKNIDDEFIGKMSAGVDIGFHLTRNCKCWMIDEFTFGIILTEGKNKQIRRMSKALGYQVDFLKRIRIAEFELGNQQVGTIEVLK